MRLEKLNDASSLDEMPSRRRRRARKTFDSAKSSADSSLVSTPDYESTPTQDEPVSVSKSLDSSDVADDHSKSPTVEQNEEVTVKSTPLSEVENHVTDDVEPADSEKVPEESTVATKETECADTTVDKKDSTSNGDPEREVIVTEVEETTEPKKAEVVAGKVDLLCID